MEIIKLENISKNFGPRIVLDNFSLSVNKGEFIAITGESGKGKSTLLNIIGLLENASSGNVMISGINNLKPNNSKSIKVIRYTISYLFQNFALIDEETVLYNLYLSLKYVKLSKKEKINKINYALSLVGLDAYKKKKVYELSGGEQQRVAIARTILKPSEIILADEPTGSLDEDNAELVFKLLKELNCNGKTIVMVTHNKLLANKCDRLISI